MNQYTIIPFLAKNRKVFILIIFILFLFLVYTEWVSMFSRLDGKKQAEKNGSGPCAQKSLSLNGCSRWQSGPSEKPGLIFVIVFHNTADCTREVVKSLKAKDDDFEGMVKINQALDRAQIGPLVSEWTAFVADSTSKVVKVVFNGQIIRSLQRRILTKLSRPSGMQFIANGIPAGLFRGASACCCTA